MAKKAELKAVLSMDMSPFSRSAARALATGKALARQFARNPVKLLATGAFLGAEKAVRGMGSAFGNMAGRAGRAMTGLYVDGVLKQTSTVTVDFGSPAFQVGLYFSPLAVFTGNVLDVRLAQVYC